MNKRSRNFKRLSKQIKSKLNDENKLFLEMMRIYLNDKKITSYDLEKVYYDIANLLYQAQIDGRNCKDVIGEDYQVFCDELLQEVPRLSNMMMYLKYFSLFILCVAFSLFYAFVREFIYYGWMSVLNIRLNHVLFFLQALCGFVLASIFIKKHLFNKPEYYTIVLFTPMTIFFIFNFFMGSTYTWNMILFEIELIPFVLVELLLFSLWKCIDIQT